MEYILDRADTRGYANYGWLKTYYTFSFANYYNPKRMGFGALRVLNDDTIAANMGFDSHPHNDMEVVTLPLKGQLRHGDSLENTEIITFGQIQVMSAGSGIVHSEYNASNTPLELLQIWILPKTLGGKPSYHSFDITNKLHKNTLNPIIAPNSNIALNQQAWFYLGEFQQDTSLSLDLHSQKNGLYVFVIEGSVGVEELKLNRRDGAGFYNLSSPLPLSISKESMILAIEVTMQF